jgi:glycosyltransferase involved in cell wall biosynthesis
LGKCLTRCGSILGFRRAAARFSSRRVPESIRAKTRAFTWPAIWFACWRKQSGLEAAKGFRGQMRAGRALGLTMVKRGFGNATHLYSMLGECGPILLEAKRRGLIVISEVYILLSTERIVAKERRAWPDWEPPQPDLDPIRREFAEANVLLTHTDFAICPSEAVRVDLEDNFGFPRGRTAVVPYGVDSQWLALRSRPQEGRVLFAGTADLRKGIHYLAMAEQSLHAEGLRCQFRVAGDVTAQIANHPACGRLVFLGRIPRDRIHEEFASADVLALPSLAEGSAEVTYEALAAGVPVITTRAAGSVVRDGMDGQLVPERDPIELARAIRELIQNRALRQRMAARARERARDYTLEHYGQRLLAALRSFSP